MIAEFLGIETRQPKRRRPFRVPAWLAGSGTPNLSDAEVAELKRRADAGDRIAADAMFRSVVPLLIARVRSWWARDWMGTVFQNDAFGAACLGVAEAVRRFDPERGRFVVLADRCITSALSAEYRRETRSAVRPLLGKPQQILDGSFERDAAAMDARAALDSIPVRDRELIESRYKWGRPPSLLAKRRGVTVYQIRRRIDAIREKLAAAR